MLTQLILKIAFLASISFASTSDAQPLKAKLFANRSHYSIHFIFPKDRYFTQWTGVNLGCVKQWLSQLNKTHLPIELTATHPCMIINPLFEKETANVSSNAKYWDIRILQGYVSTNDLGVAQITTEKFDRFKTTLSDQFFLKQEDLEPLAGNQSVHFYQNHLMKQWYQFYNFFNRTMPAKPEFYLIQLRDGSLMKWRFNRYIYGGATAAVDTPGVATPDQTYGNDPQAKEQVIMVVDFDFL